MLQGVKIMKCPLAKESSGNLHIPQRLHFGCDNFHSESIYSKVAFAIQYISTDKIWSSITYVLPQ